MLSPVCHMQVRTGGMTTSLALVHHANQFLITDGYDNREGISDIVGSVRSGYGMAAALEVHRQLGVPLNLHISGTLLEAIAWHCPHFIDTLRAHLATGLIELVGSSYGQNIMRFFEREYNLRQLNEELALYRDLLGIDPHTIKTFWPPERVWDTRRLAPVLRDAKLLNAGYRSVILDDRTLLAPDDPELPRHALDDGAWTPTVYRVHEIERGFGLAALPIATRLRRSIPPQQDEHWGTVRAELEALLVHAADTKDGLLAVYADDMEKVIGVWGATGPQLYEQFLRWVAAAGWVQPVKLHEWLAAHQPTGTRTVEPGTFAELATEFEAGEAYERWYLADDWAPYREQFEWADAQVRQAKLAGGDAALLDLAEKQLLVANWETAWHTPATGAHGNPSDNGGPSPWAKALTSHCRHAAVTAAAALWLREPTVQAELRDIDHDGHPEVILSNRALFAVLTPRWGGRVVSLYARVGGRGVLVIGNPCDDWNFQEELNRFMEVPRNHPGACADVGHENDEYTCAELHASEEGARARLEAADGTVKVYSLAALGGTLSVAYRRSSASRLLVECGLSPDYLALLRAGSAGLHALRRPQARGFCHGDVAVSVVIPPDGGLQWEETARETFGHGRAVRLSTQQRECRFAICVEHQPRLAVREQRAQALEPVA